MKDKRILFALVWFFSLAIVAILNWHRGLDVVFIIWGWATTSLYIGYVIGREVKP